VLTLRRRSVLGLVALTPVLLASACTGTGQPAAAQPGTLSIGLLTAMTGVGASGGQDAIRGATLALDIVNNVYPQIPLALGPGQGVRGGIKLTLSVGDTQGAAEHVDEQVTKLVNGGAVGLVLVDNTEVAQTAGRRIDILGVALIDALSTADLFADLNRSGHFRIQPSDSADIGTAIDLLYRERAHKRTIQRVVVVTGSGGPPEQSASIADTASGLAANAGYTVTEKLPLGGDAANLDSQINNDNADAVLVYVGSAQDAATAADLAARLKGKIPVIGYGPGADVLDAAPRVGQSTMLRVSNWSGEYARRNPVAYSVSQLYEAKFGGKFTEIAADAFTATMTMAVSVSEAKGPTAADVRSAVQQLQIPATQTIMPWGGIRFDSNGNNQLGEPVVEQHTSAGFQVVGPAELSSASLTWP
jgi:branched-chain amino acid transport system substrate-binding protein